MVTMTAALSSELPIPKHRHRSDPFTQADLDAQPDDGYRHELLDGVLIVSPAPVTSHQRAVGRMFRLLSDACVTGMEVFTAPFDVVLSEDTTLEPDVLVARVEDLTDANLPAPPQLVVEVMSPSTWRYDRYLKRSRYEDAGTPAFWIVDPNEPSVTAWELRDGRYEEAGHATGDEVLELTVPYPMRIVPADLVSAHRP